MPVYPGAHNHQRLHSSLGDAPPSEFEAPRDYEITGTVDLSPSLDNPVSVELGIAQARVGSRIQDRIRHSASGTSGLLAIA
jgi:hypothetical protein